MPSLVIIGIVLLGALGTAERAVLDHALTLLIERAQSLTGSLKASPGGPNRERADTRVRSSRRRR